jgi:hypothetical protein
VTIQPEIDDLPNYLKKSYTRETMSTVAALAASISEISGQVRERTIKNEWVAETPSEFRSKLHDVFNLGSVKYTVLSLVTGSQIDNSDAGDSVCDNRLTETE